MKKETRKRWNLFKAIGAACVAVVLLDIALIKILYDNYQDKMRIIGTMIEKDTTMETVAGILKKNEKIDISDGKELLKHYGYTMHGGDVLYLTFRQQCRVVTGTSFLAVFFCIGVFFLLKKRQNEMWREDISYLELLLSDCKKGVAVSENTGTIFYNESELSRLYSEIISFNNTLKLLKEKEALEKESTRSMVSDISHQLKTPVAALKTSFEILQGDISPEEKREFTGRCSLQIQGIENLLGALINISRMETGMISIHLEEHPIFETILEAVNRVYEKADEKNIQIELQSVDGQDNIIVMHDKKWLCEALINLLENAVKYSPRNTIITIKMEKLINFLRIEIQDQGIGISREEYNAVFQRFYRGKAKEVKSQSGSGIGLYLTREIIERHYGTIRVSSQTEEGKQHGSVFMIQLPCQMV